MRRVRYLARAKADLSEIADYYGAIDEEVADRVMQDIETAIGRLHDFPNLGERIGTRTTRRILSSRYRFKIAYRVQAEAIEVVGIFRFQDRTV